MSPRRDGQKKSFKPNRKQRHRIGTRIKQASKERRKKKE